MFSFKEKLYDCDECNTLNTITYIGVKEQKGRGVYKCHKCGSLFVKKEGGTTNNPNFLLVKDVSSNERSNCRICNKTLNNKFRSKKRKDMCILCMSGE